jgi:hypothetical protein
VSPDGLDRREVLKTVVSASLLPVLPVGAATYTPKFLSPADLELVAVLGELILPQTDTPGARAAKVHEHIDLVLSEETAEVQGEFRKGLAWLNRRSGELYRQNFAALDQDKQTALLSRIAYRKKLRPEDERGYRFFVDLRRRVVFAYYTTEIGIRQELTYKGKQVLGHWEGCPHPGHHGDGE